MVSIKTIAEECGVSIATVSKALNGHSDVGAATRDLVCETAKRLGYLPNAQARALKTNKTYNIGVLLDDKAKSGLTHAFFSAVLDGFRVEAAKKGYDITLINILNGQVGTGVMSCYEHCMYRNVDGVLATCVDFYSNEIRELLDSEIPLLSIDYRREKCYSVSSDNTGGMRSIVEYVHSCGHEKIAYIYGDSSQVTTMRLNSYLDTMKSLGLQVHPDYLRQAKYVDTALTEKYTSDMLRLYDPPTCIIVPDDVAAIGAMNAVKKLGMTIPDDISLVGYDGVSMIQLLEPSLTTYCQDTYEIGTTAADKLIKLIQKELIDEEYDTIISGYLIQGNTVKHI
ncbi:MAG: LacI family DNA-binding transcriptional regulator [Porcipelethomonas sp.]